MAMSTERVREEEERRQEKPRETAGEREGEPMPGRPAAAERSPAWRSMRWNRTIFGRTPEVGGIPAPMIVVAAALIGAMLILYLVISRQSPLIGGDTGDPGQPIQPEIQEEAPLDPG
jgi:hypothetical protein